jgi:CRP-like cAMP-binding protein
MQILKEVNELKEGQSFGELALITDKPRTATIYTKRSHTSLGVLTKKDYQNLIGESFKTKMDRAVQLLRRFGSVFKLIK